MDPRPLRLLRELERRPLDYVQWLPNQLSFIKSAARAKQIRQGNQWGGKTWASLAEVIWHCIGEHPYHAVPPPPVEWWIICATHAQSVAIQGKLWELLPKDLIAADTVYSPRLGFRGKEKVVMFRNGSVIRFKTTRQGALNLAGASIDGALFDEPPTDERILSEVMARLTDRGGVLLLSYTPVNAPVAHLRSKCEAGTIEDHWSPCTVEALTPVGASTPMVGRDGVIRDQAWIDAKRAQYPAHERPVVIDGEWEFRSIDRYFDVYTPDMELKLPLESLGRCEIVIGIDHGSRPGKQIALLVLIYRPPDAPADLKDEPYVYVLDEYVDTTGRAVTMDDARGIKAMLDRHDLHWSEVDHAAGDRVHMPDTAYQKSNKDLYAKLCILYAARFGGLKPQIRTVKRGEAGRKGAVSIGSRWLHAAMVTGRFAVHPRCERLRGALNMYTMADDDHKDPIDALRYALDRYIYRTHRGGRGPGVAWG